jgi:hypothetical protein
MIAKKFLSKSIDEYGYPSWDFEKFYQRGVDCYCWGLPKHLRKQAFKKVVGEWQSKKLKVHTWQIRAFVEGTQGKINGVAREVYVAPDYRWPIPVDAAWELVVCVYRGGYCELDMLHPVSGVFWSEENGFIEPPKSFGRTLNQDWYQSMGFDMLFMNQDMQVSLSNPTPHLRLVK